MPVRDPAGEGEASREGELTHSSRKWWLEWSPPSAAPGSGTWHLHPTSSARDDVDREAAMRGNSIDLMGTMPGSTQGWTGVGGLRAEDAQSKGKECLPRNNTHRPEQTQAAGQAVLRLGHTPSLLFRVSSVPPDPKPAHKIG